MTLASKVGTCWSIAQSKPYLRPMVPSMMGRASPDLLTSANPDRPSAAASASGSSTMRRALTGASWRFSTLRALVASTTVEKGVVPGVPTMP